MRKKRVLLLLAGLLAGNRQTLAQDSTTLRYIITTQPTQHLFRDFGITIEKVFRRRTVGITLSYRPATRDGGSIGGGKGIFGYYLDNNFTNRNYNAFTIGYTGKYFPKVGSNWFFEAAVFYRYWWFNNKRCDYDPVESGYSFDALRTEHQNVYGVKFSFGHTFYLRTGGQVKPVVEPFLGIGLRYKTYVFESWQGTVHGQYYDYLKEQGNSWRNYNNVTAGFPFSIQGGIRLGIGY